MLLVGLGGYVWLIGCLPVFALGFGNAVVCCSYEWFWFVICLLICGF